MDLNFGKHKERLNAIYKNPKYPNAIDSWLSHYAQNRDDVLYSNWRHIHRKRKQVENRNL